jgi:hypothetical protein
MSEHPRKLKKLPDSLWRLEDEPVRKTMRMDRLKEILEAIRKEQIELNGLGPEVDFARVGLELIWKIANGLEEMP